MQAGAGLAIQQFKAFCYVSSPLFKSVA